MPVCSLAAYSKGFVAGCGSGALKVFERSDDGSDMYRCLKVREQCPRAATHGFVPDIAS